MGHDEILNRKGEMGRYQPTDGGQHDPKKDVANDCRRDGSGCRCLGRLRRSHSAIFADDDDDEGQGSLIKLLDALKINLQQGLTASEQQGQPI